MKTRLEMIRIKTFMIVVTTLVITVRLII
ncbi:hypothetical protein Gohar_025157 [Gossypium harknessii]|uniref:Uncharacterized protein n=1 Tax=Gossypium harknessii TaxID=34285 RepID=A0A7J9HI56_9ROSI|nr:hypothetical protein [Gossypium harknessii]